MYHIISIFQIIFAIFKLISAGINKDEIYVLEINLEMINVKTKDVKFKQASIYPSVKKDLAFIVPKDMNNSEVEEVIKKSGSRILKDIEVFDIYTGDNIENNKKSIAYSLTFEDSSRTLTDEEVTNIFNKIINDVESKLDAKLRNM